MQDTMNHKSGWNSGPWRAAAWLAAAALMLLASGAALTLDEFQWTASDFVFAAVILGGGAGLFDLATRKAPNFAYLAGAGFALAAGFGLLWVNGAVGLVGSEKEAHNLLFGIVLLVAIAGAVAARGRPVGLARAMLAAAAVHVAVSAGLLIDAGGVSDGSVVAEVVGLSLFAGLWLASAWLFRSAAR